MQNKRAPMPRPPRQMAWWKVLLIDLGLLIVSLLVFALFDHVLPQKQQAVPMVQATLRPTPQPTPVAAAESQNEAASEATAAPVVETAAVTDPGDFSAKFADKFTGGEVIQTENTYQSGNINLTLTRYETMLDDNAEVYFVADVYVRNIECLRTLFADDNYGKSINEAMVSMSQRCGALVATNSDYYSFRTTGTVIRNGVMYRGGVSPDMQVAILFRDGTMKAYMNESELDMNQVMADGAWQGFCFGPSLLDENGNLWPSYESVNHNPRTILGMVEPGHYLLIVIDGRQGSYSEGMTYRECAELCQQLGCKFAFNLDGGKTSQMTWMGEVINQPYAGGRDTSDIIYIAEPGA